MLNTSSLVSIALATYNGERFLREQLDSLLAQTYQNIEIVISDDGSTDATQAILAEYALQDSRIRWFENPKERGVVSNFTEAITSARGDIIFLCDQDDVWYPEKIAAHVSCYADPKVGWVYNEVAITNEQNTCIGHLTDTMPDYYTRARMKLRYYAWGSCVLGCATSYRARLLKHIWPADTYAPGHDSWIQLAIFPALSVHIPEVLQDYRQHGMNAVGVVGNDVPVSEVIRQNRVYLESLVRNNRLQFWKRMYLFTVLLGKRFRTYFFRQSV